jgi:murein DD-endopeptidase MepM/ murein hydrolase activator NlpD
MHGESIGNNEIMKLLHILMVWPVLGAFVLSSCGTLEWPLPRLAPKDANKPMPSMSQKTQLSRFSSQAFKNAKAVVANRGDTVYALSRRHRVPVRTIIESNNLRPPYHLRVGQQVILPRSRKHSVRRGETFYGIAQQYRVHPYDLARLNNLSPPYGIRVGQGLNLPEGSSTIKSGKRLDLSRKKPVSPRVSRKPIVVQGAIVPIPAISGKGFVWPVRGKVISGFGAKAKGMRNDGINIATSRGASVVAAENGVVVYAGNELRGFGNLLLVKHSGGWVTAYAHNENILVKRGVRVSKGQPIATVGSSGNVKNPQLHFEMRRGRVARDPRKYLQGA